MEAYDQTTGVQHFPMPMARFGLNPYGEPLHRIVLASSVRHLVGGQWAAGERCYSWRPTYRHLGEVWILETWGMPIESKRMWESLTDPVSGWPIHGPYPARGYYQHSWTFEQGVAQDNVEKIIGAIHTARERSPSVNNSFTRAEYEAEEKETQRHAYEDIRDSMTAFGAAPIASSRVSRGTKTRPETKSANELGLPMPKGKHQDLGGGYRARHAFGAA